MSEATRRSVLMSAAGAGVAAALGACGDGGDGGSGTAQPTPGNQPTTGAPPTGPLARTSDIPVGGGKIFNDRGVVVTQPTAGTFKGFTNICQHQQCPVANVEGGTINCTCHGSKYSIEDGAVKDGPAPRALPAKTINVEGDSITLA